MSNNHACRIAGVLSLCLAALPVAAQPTACAPLGELPSYRLQEDLRMRDHEMHAFPVTGSDSESSLVDLAGRYCQAKYVPKDDDAPMSDVEIQENYRSQMRALGAEIVHGERHQTTGKLVRDGATTWMHAWSQETLIEVTVVQPREAAYVLAAPAASDHRLFGAMPGYRAEEVEKRNFDEESMLVADAGESREIAVQGARHFIRYVPVDDQRVAADAGIHANYRMAVARLGGEVVHGDRNWTYARLVHEGQVVWLKLYSQETSIELIVIEEKPFQASITPPRADEMRAALDRDGRIALHVHFDFGIATLKADAGPVLEQIASLLEADADLRVSIEGHTDDIGNAAANRTLSRQRAQAVVDALVVRGIAADRLRAAGFGADQPIADNATSEGRARNRRVELVRL